MTHGQTLEQFAAACKKALQDQPGPEGRKKVRDLLRDILANDKAFVAKYITDDTPERKVLYEDPDLGFCILAHKQQGAKGPPRTTTARPGRSMARRKARP